VSLHSKKRAKGLSEREVDSKIGCSEEKLSMSKVGIELIRNL
jgi:hypothetical protein